MPNSSLSAPWTKIRAEDPIAFRWSNSRWHVGHGFVSKIASEKLGKKPEKELVGHTKTMSYSYGNFECERSVSLICRL